MVWIAGVCAVMEDGAVTVAWSTCEWPVVRWFACVGVVWESGWGWSTGLLDECL